MAYATILANAGLEAATKKLKNGWLSSPVLISPGLPVRYKVLKI